MYFRLWDLVNFLSHVTCVCLHLVVHCCVVRAVHIRLRVLCVQSVSSQLPFVPSDLVRLN